MFSEWWCPFLDGSAKPPHDKEVPRYYPIRWMNDQTAKLRTIDRLTALREKLAQEIDPHRNPGSFLLATWNIREFGRSKPKHGPRLDESFHYLAEVISRFHLVALQEVNRDLTDFRRLLSLLGPSWEGIVTDVTEGSSGNEERMAFVYDTRMVKFRNVAGEIVLPVGRRVSKSGVTDTLQFARTPFMVAFQADWFRFNLCTVHIYFGDESGAKLQRRIDEIRTVAKFFRDRQKREGEDCILLGDFNIVSPKHETMRALERHGFTVPEKLRREKTNLKGDKHYDQIALQPTKKMIEVGESGVFDFDEVVFRSTQEDRDIYQPFMSKGKGRKGGALTRYYNTWRTFQMSDHLPMWVELRVDFTNDYLNSLRPGRKMLASPSGD